MILRRAQPSETSELKQWIKENHYLRSTPPGFVCLLEFLDQGKRIGAMQIGRPTSRELDADKILEINRIYFDGIEHGMMSRALSMARKYIRCWFPQIKLLLSYSDPAQGHSGIIYQADGWAPFGKTAKSHGSGWKSRQGRRSEEIGSKQRWVRTP